MSREPALYPFGMKIASTARQLPGRKTKDEEYGRNEAFSNRRSSYTFDLPLAEGTAIFLHRDFDELFMTREAIWLDFPESWGSAWLSKEGLAFDAKYCLVAGTFNATNHGHLGSYSGAIEDVIRIATIEDMRRMRR